jgi:hypothetical protein
MILYDIICLLPGLIYLFQFNTQITWRTLLGLTLLDPIVTCLAALWVRHSRCILRNRHVAVQVLQCSNKTGRTTTVPDRFLNSSWTLLRRLLSWPWESKLHIQKKSNTYWD